MDDFKTPSNARPGEKNFERRYLMLGVAIAGDFGVVLAVPALAAALIGSRLDGRYGTKPMWLIVCLVLSAVFSAVVIRRRARDYGNRFQNLIDEEKEAKADKKGKP